MRIPGRNLELGDILLAKEDDWIATHDPMEPYNKPRILIERLSDGGWIVLKGVSVETVWLIPNLDYDVVR